MQSAIRDIALPVLPPPYDALRHDGADLFDRGVALAPARGAGTLLWGLAAGRLHVAVVLEPDRPLGAARAAFGIGMAALLEAVATHCPPERPIEVFWPGVVLFDRARLGEGRLAWPEGCAEEDEPDWLVFGFDLQAESDPRADPGRQPDVTSLRDEGFDDPAEIVDSFARHLMLYFDTWAHVGLDAAAKPWLDRLEGSATRRLEAAGALLERDADGGTRRLDLAEALR